MRVMHNYCLWIGAVVLAGCGPSHSRVSGGTGGMTMGGAGGVSGAEGDGGEIAAAGAFDGPVVNHCGCGKGAMPPAECDGGVLVGASCDETTFTACRIGFEACYFCFAPIVPGCSRSE